MAKIEAPTNVELGNMMEADACAFATEINAGLMPELDRLGKVAEDWEGGKFAVMYKVVGLMTAERVAKLPDPKDKTGNNPGVYKRKVIKTSAKGKKSEEWKEFHYYEQLARNLPGVVALAKRLALCERANNSEADHSDIPADIMGLDKVRRDAEIARLDKRIKGAINAVDGAFELFHQFKRFSSLRFVKAVPIFTQNSDGSLNDGTAGHGFEVEATKTPIHIVSTISGREAIDTDLVGIGTFLKYDVAKAVEDGGTYAAVIATAKRAKTTDEQGDGNAQDTSKPQLVNTVPTAIARIADVSEYISRIVEAKTKAEFEALEKALHGAGTDEDFCFAYELMENLISLVGSPKDKRRYDEVSGKLERDAA